MELPNYSKRVPRARKFRREPTDAEKRLWSRLRGRRLNGWKFRRQVPMDHYFADFFCQKGKLVVEVDGGQHGRNAAKDDERTKYIESLGFRVIRFWNNDVLKNTNGVLEKIVMALERG